MTDVFDENLIKQIPFQDKQSVRTFNFFALPVFTMLLVLHVRYLYKHQQVMKDFYTVTTSISCIMSLTCNI